MDFDNRPDLDIPYEMQKKNPKIPEIKVDPDFNPFADEDFGQPAKTGTRHYEKKLEYWESLMHQTQVDAGNLFNQPEETGSLINEENPEDIEAFQFQNQFIITRRQNRLLIIHQHRAHSLVLYHKMLHQLQKGHIPSQQLIFPVELQLTKPEIELLKTFNNEIENTGFDIEITRETILIKGIPLEQKTEDIALIFQEIIRQLSMDAPVEDNYVEKKLALIIAEKSAIRTGKKLEKEEINSLLRDLFQIKENIYTPEAKRIIAEMDSEGLERQFK